MTWWNRRRVDERGSRAEQEAVDQGGPAEDKRLQIEDKAHDLEGLRPGQGTGTPRADGSRQVEEVRLAGATMRVTKYCCSRIECGKCEVTG